MNQIFVDELRKKFHNKFTLEFANGFTYVVFPAKNADFGDIVVHEEEPGSYMIEIGKFTHTHCDIYDDEYDMPDDEKAKEAAEDISWLLENLFADKIICHGSHEGGGGYVWHENWIPDEHIDYFVWSGVFKKATLAE